MHHDLLELLQAAARVRDNPQWHPERSVLHHLLQAYELACKETEDLVLRAAALLHDVGKVVQAQDHDAIGADLLEGLIAPRVVWLVRHHLDLLYRPRLTRRRLRGTKALEELRRLRRWDLGGRVPGLATIAPELAVQTLLGSGGSRLLDPSAGPAAPTIDEERKDWF